MIKIEIDSETLSDMMRRHETLAREASAASARATLAEDKSWKLADELAVIKQDAARVQGPYTEGQIRALIMATKANEKIPMIKAVRALTGYGLKESKDLVEAAMLAPYIAPRPWI